MAPWRAADLLVGHRSGEGMNFALASGHADDGNARIAPFGRSNRIEPDDSGQSIV